MSSPAGHGFALGVDLGTSNTVAVVRWPDGRTRPLLVDGQPILPSAVYLDESGRLYVGRDAQRLAQLDPSRYEPNPKRHIDEPGVLLGDREVPVVDLLAAVLGAVARAAVEAVGFLPPAAVTYPAAWGPRRRDALVAAVQRAGWPPVRLLPEPVAAARYFVDVLRRPVPVGGSLAVFDFGGGTVDIAVVRNSGNGFAVLGSGGIEHLGGLDIDAAVVEHLGAILGPAQPELWRALSVPGRARHALWEDVRGAKEMLARASSAPVAVPGLAGAVHLTREELERVAAPLVGHAVQETAAVIRQCGLRPMDLAGLFLVGGSSRLPLVARLLHTELGVPPTVLEQPELPVAEGSIAELAPLAPAFTGAPRPGGSPYEQTAESITAGSIAAGPVIAGPVPVSAAPASGFPISPAVGQVSPPPAAPPVGPAAEPPGSPAVAPVVAPAPLPTSRPVRGRRRLRWVLTAVVSAVLVLALVAAGLVYWLRRESPVDFEPLASTGLTVPFGADEPSSAFSYSVGDRAYVAWLHDKSVEVAGVDLAAGKRLWQYHVPAEVTSWGGLFATEDGVVVLGYESSDDKPRPMYVLDPQSGNLLWKRDAYGDDVRFGFGSLLVVASDHDAKTYGLDWRTGRERWSLPYRTGSSGPLRTGSSAMLRTADYADTGWFGAAVNAGAVGGDGARIVQLDSDRTLRVIDAASGKARERADVGPVDTPLLAVDRRLYLVVSDSGLQLRSYDLDKLGAPTVLYTQTDSSKRLVGEPQPCGDGRVCLLERASSEAKTTEVVAVDVDKRAVAWRRAAPGADRLVPVGKRVLATSLDGEPASLLFDAAGGQVLDADDRATVGARLNGASVLLSSRIPATYGGQPLALTGIAGAGERHPLGSIDEVRSASCSWSTRYLICATAKEFRVWRFAH